MQSLWGEIQSYFNWDLFVAKVINITQNAIKAMIVLIAFYILYRIIKKVFRRVITRFDLERTFGNFLLMVIRYTVVIFGIVTALDQIGVNVGSLIAGLGIAGLSLGFAAKDTLSNIVAGIFIFWDRPFYIGDLVEIEGEYGEVKDITLRTTRIVTPDGKMVSIPNQKIAVNKVISYTVYPNLRLDMPITIDVKENIAVARAELLQVVRHDERFVDDREPVVIVTKLGDYFTELQLRVWLKDPHTHISVRADLREKMKNALDAAGIEMPYEKIEVMKEYKNPDDNFQ